MHVGGFSCSVLKPNARVSLVQRAVVSSLIRFLLGNEVEAGAAPSRAGGRGADGHSPPRAAAGYLSAIERAARAQMRERQSAMCGCLLNQALHGVKSFSRRMASSRSGVG